jgi:hypothetical protein
MNGIYSLTIRPQGDLFCGYNSKLHFLKSFYLSVTLAKKRFKDITIYCDSPGSKIVKSLNLDVKIEKIKPQNKLFYSTVKLQSILKQKEPFVHLDFDLFLLDNFKLVESPIITLNSEFKQLSKWYKKGLDEFFYYRNIEIPLIDEWSHCNLPATVYNNGLFGGYDLDTLHEFSKILLEYLELDSQFEKPYIGNQYAVALLEQYYFSIFCQNKGVEINTILDANDIIWLDLNNFVHLLAGMKRLPQGINALERLFDEHCEGAHGIVLEALS